MADYCLGFSLCADSNITQRCWHVRIYSNWKFWVDNSAIQALVSQLIDLESLIVYVKACM